MIPFKKTVLAAVTLPMLAISFAAARADDFGSQTSNDGQSAYAE